MRRRGRRGNSWAFQERRFSAISHSPFLDYFRIAPSRSYSLNQQKRVAGSDLRAWHRPWTDYGQVGSNPLGRKTRYSLKCQSSWRALASTATRIIERPARRDGERLRGKIAFAELPNGIDDRRLANPTPCGIRKNKDQLFRSHNAESRTEHPAFAKQSSLVDETGIEPATSSLRTRNH